MGTTPILSGPVSGVECAHVLERLGFRVVKVRPLSIVLERGGQSVAVLTRRALSEAALRTTLSFARLSLGDFNVALEALRLESAPQSTGRPRVGV